MRRNVINAVMGIFVAMALGLAGCGGGGGGGSTTPAAATYSNSTLTGPWLFLSSTSPDKNVYAIFDGSGIVSEFGAIKVNTPAGTYSVQTNGALNLTLNFVNDPQETFTGTLTSSTSGNLTAQAMTASIVKVSNISTCQGTWAGTLTEQNGGTATHPITVVVNSSGVVTSFTGFTLPVSGKMFSDSGNMVAHFKTAEADAYQEFRLSGNISGNSATGYFSADGSTKITGTFSLTKQ